jgi:thiol-disulfide isomerase/thioredoxin
MKKHLCSLSLLSFVALCAASLQAAELGDPAKPLDIKEWVKGSPVDLSSGKGKTVFVVEFWATWCPPCRASIPHLTELQRKFRDKGVVFIGISDEKADVVKKFVEKMGDKMNYTVALDTGKTAEGYMEAYGVNGIPHAFVVNKEGNLVWHGHPMDKLEETLEAVLSGKYDMAETKKRDLAETKLQEYVELILSGENEEKAKKLESELVALDKELGGIMHGEKFDPEQVRKQVKFSQAFMKYQQLTMTGGDTNEIARLEKELTATAPKGFDMAKVKEGIQKAIVRNEEARKAQALLEEYVNATGKDGDPAKAAELGRKLESFQTSNSETLNEIAWALLTDDSIKSRDIKLALRIAKRGVDASNGKDSSVLDTYARALYEDGQVPEAIAQQKKAVELAEDPDMKAEFAKNLEKYQAKRNEGAKSKAK